MLLTIRNLPPKTRYADIKTLIQSKCGVRELILDNLVPEGEGMKVTVGVAEESDAAILVRTVNGLYYNGCQLFVEDTRKKPAPDQYINTNNIISSQYRSQYQQSNQYQQNNQYQENNQYQQNNQYQSTSQYGNMTESSLMPTGYPAYGMPMGTMPYYNYLGTQSSAATDYGTMQFASQTQYGSMSMNSIPSNQWSGGNDSKQTSRWDYDQTESASEPHHTEPQGREQRFDRSYSSQKRNDFDNGSSSRDREWADRDDSRAPQYDRYSNYKSKQNSKNKKGPVKTEEYANVYGSHVTDSRYKQKKYPKENFRLPNFQPRKEKPISAAKAEKLQKYRETRFVNRGMPEKAFKRASQPSEESRAKKAKLAPAEEKQLMRMNTWRGQACAFLVKDILTAKDHVYLDPPHLITLKQEVRKRIDDLLGNEMLLQQDDIVDLYRKAYHRRTDAKFVQDVIGKAEKEVLLGEDSLEALEAAFVPPRIKASAAKKPVELKNEFKAPAPTEKLPKYPEGDKLMYKKYKRAHKEEEEEDYLTRLTPEQQKYVTEEVATLVQIFADEFTSPEAKEENMRPIDQSILDEFKKVVTLHVCKRLLSVTTTLLVRVFGQPRPPKKEELSNYLRPFGVISLKKCDRSPLFVANCGTFEGYDKLLATQHAELGENIVTFKAMHATGVPDKKDARAQQLHLRAKQVQAMFKMYDQRIAEYGDLGFKTNNDDVTIVETDHKEPVVEVVEIVRQRLLGDCSKTIMKVHMAPSPPRKELVDAFFRQHRLTTVRKSTGKCLHYVCCESFDIYDKLVAMGRYMFGHKKLNFKPMFELKANDKNVVTDLTKIVIKHNREQISRMYDERLAALGDLGFGNERNDVMGTNTDDDDVINDVYKDKTDNNNINDDHVVIVRNRDQNIISGDDVKNKDDNDINDDEVRNESRDNVTGNEEKYKNNNVISNDDVKNVNRNDIPDDDVKNNDHIPNDDVKNEERHGIPNNVENEEYNDISNDDVENDVHNEISGDEVENEVHNDILGDEVENVIHNDIPGDEVENEVHNDILGDEVEIVIHNDIPGDEVENVVHNDIPSYEVENEVHSDIPSDDVDNEVHNDIPGDNVENEVHNDIPSDDVDNQVHNDIPGDDVENEVHNDIPGDEVEYEVHNDIPGDDVENEKYNDIPNDDIENEVHNDADHEDRNDLCDILDDVNLDFLQDDDLEDY